MCHSQFFFLIKKESNHHTDYYHSYVISHLVTPTGGYTKFEWWGGSLAWLSFKIGTQYAILGQYIVNNTIQVTVYCNNTISISAYCSDIADPLYWAIPYCAYCCKHWLCPSPSGLIHTSAHVACISLPDLQDRYSTEVRSNSRNLTSGYRWRWRR
jgi:hypothetical protein